MFRRSCVIAVSLALGAACVSLAAVNAAPEAPAGARGAPGTPRGARELELLSRSLIEGPSRTAALFDRGVVLGTGCGVAVFPENERLGNPSFVPLEGDPRDILVAGDVAYVAVFNDGLTALDLADPERPRLTSRHPLPQAVGCAQAGGALYVADFRGNIVIFNLDNPREPLFREMRGLPRPAVSICAEGGLLCVAQERLVTLYRAAPGTALRSLSELSVPAGVKKIRVANGVLCVLAADGAFRCWDVASAERPAAIEPPSVRGIVDFAIDGSRGMLLAGSGFITPFEMRRAGDSAKRGERASIEAGKSFSAAGVASGAGSHPRRAGAAPDAERVTGIALSGEQFALLSPFDGLRLCAAGGAGAKLLDAFATRGVALELVAARDILYVANAGDGVRIGRVGAAGTVEWIGHIQTTEARDVALNGTTLVIADGADGIRTADVSDPRTPRIIGHHASPFFMCAVAVRGHRAYCAGGLGGAEVVDISDAARPKLVWRRELSEVRGVSADDRYFYFADGNDGLRIWALDDSTPVPLSVLDTPGWNCDVFVEGNTAYLADGGNGIVVADIGDRKKPRAVGSLSLDTVARELHLRGKTLFAAGQAKGVFAIDVSNPRAPRIEAVYDSADDARGVFADERFVYLASASGGVSIFRYSR